MHQKVTGRIHLYPSHYTWVSIAQRLPPDELIIWGLRVRRPSGVWKRFPRTYLIRVLLIAHIQLLWLFVVRKLNKYETYRRVRYSQTEEISRVGLGQLPPQPSSPTAFLGLFTFGSVVSALISLQKANPAMRYCEQSSSHESVWPRFYR